MKKLTLILFIFVMLSSAQLMLISTSVYADKIVVKFKGPNSKITPIFKIKPGWQIKYHAKEDAHFSVVVHDEHGKYIDLAVNIIGPRKGLSYQEKGGKYYLDVTATGNWNIEIIQIKR